MNVESQDTALYLVSIASADEGPKGAVLVEFADTPSLQAIRVEPDGEDAKLMERHRYYTAEEMHALGY